MNTDFDTSSLSGLDTKAGDKDLQEFLMVEKQKAQFNAQVRLCHAFGNNNFGH